MDDEKVSNAVKILKSAINLERLEFADEIPLSSTEAFQAVIELQRLRSVSITSDELAGLFWLKHTKSPISEVKIDDWSREIIPMSELVGLATHLTTLDLNVHGIATANACFSRLRSLVLRVYEPVTASSLASIFPNLDYADIIMHNTDEPEFPSEDEANNLHESNAGDLASSLLPLPRLKTLTAHAHDLYLSAFTPRADEFLVYETLQPDGGIQTMLRKILPAIRPRVLEVSIFFKPEKMAPWQSLKSFISFISNMTSLKTLRLELGSEFEGVHTAVEHVVRFPPIFWRRRFKHPLEALGWYLPTGGGLVFASVSHR
ncbi:hypothetical protein NLI96_g2916 [Meripilus lineatus]|uniref:F-box domain-containing protein n=1 Tax=Meripilus lineatus TaxID=2056292 RepID=A0AAD5V9B8_9APHY|nr:hypothetical protein NLI96_g2916 [Physisporinus lineatus]